MDIKEMTKKIEELKLKLELAQLQEALNKYAPEQHVNLRCKCPRCDANFEQSFDVKYFK